MQKLPAPRRSVSSTVPCPPVPSVFRKGRSVVQPIFPRCRKELNTAIRSCSSSAWSGSSGISCGTSTQGFSAIGLALRTRQFNAGWRLVQILLADLRATDSCPDIEKSAKLPSFVRASWHSAKWKWASRFPDLQRLRAVRSCNLGYVLEKSI